MHLNSSTMMPNLNWVILYLPRSMFPHFTKDDILRLQKKLQDSPDANDAVYELNGKELRGERVIVEHARGPRRDHDGYSYGSRSGGGG